MLLLRSLAVAALGTAVPTRRRARLVAIAT
jgi:hypothetical protein